MKRLCKALLLMSLVVQILACSIGFAAEKKTTLRFSWWGGTVRHKATLDAIALYSKKNPNVKIEAEYGGFDSYYEKLVTQLAGDTAPDIIQIDYKWIYDLAAQSDSFVDLRKVSKYVKTQNFEKKFLEEHCSVNAKLLGLPTGLNGRILLANTNLLKEAGIPLNNDWDWDKILEAGKKVQNYDQNKHLFFISTTGFFDIFKTMIRQKYNHNFIKDDNTIGFTKQDLVEVFTYYRKLIDTGVIVPPERSALYDSGVTDQNLEWLSGQCGFVTAWASTLTTTKNASKFPINITRYPIPKKAKSPGILVNPAQILCINKKSQNINEAAKFLNWFFNDKEAILILKDCRGIPPTKVARDLLADADLMDKDVAKAADLAIPYGGGPQNASCYNREIEAIGFSYIQQVGFKRLTPEEAAEGFVKDLKQKLAEIKK